MFPLFLERKMGNFCENSKRVLVGGWFRYLGICPKKYGLFLTPFLSICFSPMTVFAWLCFADKKLLIFGSNAWLFYGQYHK